MSPLPQSAQVITRFLRETRRAFAAASLAELPAEAAGRFEHKARLAGHLAGSMHRSVGVQLARRQYQVGAGFDRGAFPSRETGRRCCVAGYLRGGQAFAGERWCRRCERFPSDGFFSY
jgi:hypothetical protein